MAFLIADYRSALPFLNLTWSHRTLRSNLDRLTAWERDFNVQARVQIAAASFKVSTENPQKRKCPKEQRVQKK